MIEHGWTVVCNRCIVDPSTNNASLMEVFEQANVEGSVQFPVVAPLQLDIVTAWHRSDPERGERGTGRFRMINPDGTALAATEYAIDLTHFFRSRAIGRLAGLPLAALGRYFFQVEIRVGEHDWREVAKIPFHVASVEGLQAGR